MLQLSAKMGDATEKTRKPLPRNPRTYKLFPKESFIDHPVGWLKWMKSTNYNVTDPELKELIKAFFKKRESRYEKAH
jgi:hypothetical protein